MEGLSSHWKEGKELGVFETKQLNMEGSKRISGTVCMLIMLGVLISWEVEFARAGPFFCLNPGSPCRRKFMPCPFECPNTFSDDPKAKVCDVDCNSPLCQPVCKNQTANCDGPGAACHDPRFIGADGIVFYFHGKSNEDFTLVSDAHLQINGRFIGHRPAGRSRDFTWIRALGLLFETLQFSVEAVKTPTWNDQVDNLKFTYNGEEVVIPQAVPSVWYNSAEKEIKVERAARRNSVVVTLKDAAEIRINVVPVTKEDDKTHGYRVPSDDCFAHLEVQFRFFGLSSEVEGVLGRTYRPDFVNPAKPGVAMPVVGGEDKYRTSSLLSADCKTCLFNASKQVIASVTEFETMDCTKGASSGYGIVCKK